MLMIDWALRKGGLLREDIGLRGPEGSTGRSAGGGAPPFPISWVIGDTRAVGFVVVDRGTRAQETKWLTFLAHKCALFGR